MIKTGNFIQNWKVWTKMENLVKIVIFGRQLDKGSVAKHQLRNMYS